jgi:hypothetical protein
MLGEDREILRGIELGLGVIAGDVARIEVFCARVRGLVEEAGQG